MPNNGESRSAVILYGLLHRSLAYTGRSIERCLLAPLRAAGGVDVFYHSWDITRIDNFRTGEIGTEIDPREIPAWLPEARGLIESQQAFDQAQDWEPLFAHNIMRKCSPTEDTARLTLMNQFRTLESLQRAWDFFQQHKPQTYARVVATRPDLRFLTPLPLLDAEQGLFLPAFQDWGGVNDRFAVGSEAQIAIYSRRKAFWEQHMHTSDEGNAEKLLKRWLIDQNEMRPRFFDFVFLRARADGHFSPHDLDSAQAYLAQRHQARATASLLVSASVQIQSERFVILSQQAGPAAHRLQRLFGAFGPTDLLVNQPEAHAQGVWYPDAFLSGAPKPPHPAAALAARVLLELELQFDEAQAVWLIDEAVAGSPHAFGQLLRVTHDLDPDLAAYGLKPENLGQTAFPPLCRLGPRLIAELLALRARRPELGFNQLFPSLLAAQPDFRLLDWQQPGLRPCFGSFRAQPDVDRIGPGISHPVTNLYSHLRICSLSAGENL